MRSVEVRTEIEKEIVREMSELVKSAVATGMQTL